VGADFPRVEPRVFQTPAGTRYLTSPGVITLARQSALPSGLSAFLDGFPADLELGSALADDLPLTPGASVCKTAGQLCYMSFGPKRTPNAEAARYFANILRSGHGSVLEHAVCTFLLYGVSRSVTHELVRHRAGFAYSQVSQRYVSAQSLRFVERPEFAADPELHRLFEARIDRASADHLALEQKLRDRQADGSGVLAAERATDRRKRIQQAARALLPNEVEAPIIVTGNVRAWRHFVEARANAHADIEIRMLAYAVFVCLRHMEPILFADYAETPLEDGSVAVSTPTPKV
jgi:thymidylate synthase (FAD)